MGGACHGSRQGATARLLFFSLFFFFFSPFIFFVNERKRSCAVPGIAALGVLAAASSERAARSSSGLAPVSAPARRLQPAQAEDPRRRRGPAA